MPSLRDYLSNLWLDLITCKLFCRTLCVAPNRSKGRVEVQAIGAGAINQAVKAIAISRGYVAPGGLDLVCIPAFIDISIDGEERTGIRLLVESR